MTKRQDAQKDTKEDAAADTMGDLIAGLNHDIRTSMNGIAGMLALLLDSGLSAAQRELMTKAQSCAENLTALIENIVDLSMIKTGEFKLAQSSFDFSTLLRTTADEKGLALQLHGPSSLTLRGDATRLRQVISGLLNVALRVTRHGSPSVDANAECRDTGHCRVHVAVNGLTLDSAGRQLLEMLNKPAQDDLSILRTLGQVGLELALCKRLAGLMGAQIETSIQPEEPCCIRFSVELERAVAPGPDVSPQAVRSAISGRRILVADDNAINRQVAQRMAESLGCTVELAVDGEQAIAMHAAQPYDLILMDCQMPKVDGYQATQRIRSLDGSARRTPIIAVTACATQGERERCLTKGMDDFITKPVRPQMLEQAFARWLPASAQSDDAGHADELHVVRDMFGADFAELATLYQNDSPPRIAALRRACAALDYPQVTKVAHAFSGSSVSIGATGLSALCKELELRAKAGELDDSAARLASIEDEYNRVSGKLQAMTRSDWDAR